MLEGERRDALSGLLCTYQRALVDSKKSQEALLSRTRVVGISMAQEFTSGLPLPTEQSHVIPSNNSAWIHPTCHEKLEEVARLLPNKSQSKKRRRNG
jgi:hypothetical protein